MSNNARMIEVHTLTSYGNGVICGGSDGMQKTVRYGGSNRILYPAAAIGSGMRRYYGDEFGGGAVRTTAIGELVKRELVRQGRLPEDKAREVSDAMVEAVGIRINKTDLFVLTCEEEIGRIAAAIIEYGRSGGNILEDKKGKKKATDKEDSQEEGKAIEPKVELSQELKKSILDIFRQGNDPLKCFHGTFLSGNDSVSRLGAKSLADGIGTERYVENDGFWVARDDELGRVANMGYSPSGTGTVYKYMAIDLDSLRGYLGKEVAIREAVRQVESFVMAAPSAKRRTAAKDTRPRLTLAIVRGNLNQYTMTGAFEKPCDDLEDSIRRMAKYYDDVVMAWDRVGDDRPSSQIASMYLAPEDEGLFAEGGPVYHREFRLLSNSLRDVLSRNTGE